MTPYVEKQHRCPLPYIEGNGDLWRCGECGDTWRSFAPGNPAYNRWLRAHLQNPWRATWIGRLLRLHSPSAELLGQCWCQRD
jgi:hypothetical protein